MFADSEGTARVRAALGALLRRRREATGRSLNRLADEARFSPAFLSEVERGLKEVSMARLLRLARTLGLEPADLYLELARELRTSDAVAERAWPQDPRARLRLAAQTLPPQAVRSVADFSVYLAAAGAARPRRRIGFTLS
jgi:XRE family transcriptional regulator, stress-response regulator